MDRLPEVLGASFEMTPEMVAMMENFADGVDFSQIDFSQMGEAFMDHMFEGENGMLPEQGGFEGPNGHEMFDAVFGDNPEFEAFFAGQEGFEAWASGGENSFDWDNPELINDFIEQFGQDVTNQMEQEIHEYENNYEEQINNMNQDQQPPPEQISPECQEHLAAPPHDPDSDGHTGC